MTPAARDLARWVRTRAQVLMIENDALDAARQEKPTGEAQPIPPSQSRPRPLMVLPEHRRLRRLLMGLIVHRPAQH